MKPNLIISFASGMLISAGVCGYIYFSEPEFNSKTSAATIEYPSENDMKKTLEQSGYVILTEEEFMEQSADSTEKIEEPVQEEKIVYRTVVNVAPGMTSIDVGHALVHGKIIDNARDFFDVVEKRGLSNKLKPGTFELDSDMTLDEVVQVILR